MKGKITNHTRDTIDFQEDGKDGKVFRVAEWVKPEFFKVGRAEITVKDNLVSFISMEGQEKQVKTEKNWTDDMTNFEDLLNSAHRKFDPALNINTEMLSVDLEKKQAIFKATVSTNEGIFMGHGDAEGITNDLIKPHFIRMAETRAIARALRWATNNAKCAEEEK